MMMLTGMSRPDALASIRGHQPAARRLDVKQSDYFFSAPLHHSQAARRGKLARKLVPTFAAVRCFVDDDVTGGHSGGGRSGLSGPGIFELAGRAGLVPTGSLAMQLMHGGSSGGGPRNRGASVENHSSSYYVLAWHGFAKPGRGGGGGDGGGKGDDDEGERNMRWIWRVRHYYDPLYAFTVMLLHFAAAWLLMVLVVWEMTRRRGKGMLPGVSVPVMDPRSTASRPGESVVSV